MNLANRIFSNTFTKYLFATAFSISAIACGVDSQLEQQNFEPMISTESDRSALAWSTDDDPSNLDAKNQFNYTFSDLPLSGEADVTPWAGSYWPTFRDSINFRWDGSSGITPGASLAPSEKFAQAFNRPDLMDNVSRQYGIESRQSSPSCSTDSECEGSKGEVCSKRNGETQGRCIETWFGICHAWAPAAILVSEPINDVTYNNVTFKVNDIKALVSLSYTNAVQNIFLSRRCDDPGEDLEFDEYGRPFKSECMDTNPGTFHVVVANLLGLQKKSFVEDKTYDYQVWNQPVRSYQVLKNDAVTAEQANGLISATSTTYLFNKDAVSFRHIQMEFSYIFEPAQHVGGNLSAVIDNYTAQSRYEYILELDTQGKIIGGEWLGNSKRNHPDFLWTPTLKGWTEIAKDSGQSGTGIAWHEVKYLVEESIKSSTSTTNSFDWGDMCDAGNGNFTQAITEKQIVDVGEIPAGKANVRIDLTSPEDVDVQLYDKQTGHALVAWPSGDLSGHGVQTTTYEGMNIEYSGYNGVGDQLGHEYISISGDITRPLVMKAYGYRAGTATVTYSYEAAANCVDAGTGDFEQDVVMNDVIEVGRIKKDKENIRIQLQSATDLDIQLYDGPVALIKWPDGQLNGSSQQTLTYKGMTLTWSGWAGINGNYGNEYISIEGKVPAELTMRVFGYRAGSADLKYAWGLASGDLSTSLF